MYQEQKLLFLLLVFGRKVFLIFPIIYQTVDLKLICINWPIWPNLLFDLCWYLPWMTQLLTLGASFPFSWVSWLLNFLRQDVFLFGSHRQCWHTNYIEITWSVMPKPVYLLTVQEVHKEYNSLTDQIWAKYKQLDSCKYGSVDTPAFIAEACELANLLARVSQLCQKLNLLTPKELYRPTFFKNWRCFWF